MQKLFSKVLLFRTPVLYPISVGKDFLVVHDCQCEISSIMLKKIELIFLIVNKSPNFLWQDSLCVVCVCVGTGPKKFSIFENYP